MLEPDGARAPAAEHCVARVPVAVWRRMALSGASWLRRRLLVSGAAAFEYDLWLAFCAGVVWQRWHATAPSATEFLPADGLT